MNARVIRNLKIIQNIKLEGNVVSFVGFIYIYRMQFTVILGLDVSLIFWKDQ